MIVLHRLLIWVALVSVPAFGEGAAQPRLPGAPAATASDASPAQAHEHVLNCVLAGRQANWKDSGWQCDIYSTAERPFWQRDQRSDEWLRQLQHGFDACKSRSSQARLPSNLLTLIADDSRYRANPKPIRIFGGVFCDGIQAIGTRLPSLVALDWSISFREIVFQNTHIGGDFSLDNAIVLDDVLISRSALGGMLSLRQASFIAPVRIEDVSLGSWLSLRRAKFLDALAIDRVRTGGFFEIDRTQLSFLLMRNNTVDGRIELTHATVRCAAHITKNRFGDVIMADSGFVWQADATGRQWSRAEPDRPSMQQLVDHVAAAGLVEQNRLAARLNNRNMLLKRRKTCDFGASMTDPSNTVIGPFYAGAIQFHDNTVQTNLCVRNIRWPQPDASQAANTDIHLCRGSNRTRALVSFRNSSAGSMIIFNPVAKRGQTANASDQDTSLAPNPRDICSNLLTVHTISTRTLVVDLSDPPKIDQPGSTPFHMDLDGLAFERVHNADITCFFYGQPERAETQSQSPSPQGDHPVRPPNFRYPEPAQILGWLRLNSAPSSQVFGAFADALQKSGVGSTSLRIERNWQDIQRAYAGMSEPSGGLWWYLTGKSPAGGTFLDNGRSLVGNRLWAAHGYLTHFGHNPERVILPSLALIIFAWIIQILIFRIGAAEVDTPAKYISLGPLFILDRFVPLYKLREEHSKIRRYLIRKPLPDENVEALIVAGSRVQYFERMLVALKIIGVFAAVFLAAAIGSLVAR